MPAAATLATWYGSSGPMLSAREPLYEHAARTARASAALRDGHDDRVRAERESDRGGHRGVLRVGGGNADEPVTEAVEGAQGPAEGSRGVQTLAEAVDQDDRSRTHGPRRLVAPVGQDRAHERRAPPEQFPERIGAMLVRGAVEGRGRPIVRGVDPLLVDGRRGALHHHHQVGSDPDEPHAEALVQRSRRVVAQQGAGHLAVLRAECRKVGDSSASSAHGCW